MRALSISTFFPNIRSIFGDESDVNADGKVSVVITPVLNQMTRGLDEEELEIDLDISLVGSYADPSIDLSDYEPSENPMSDEEEVIFLHAPDPYGFHNPEALTPISEYTNVTLGTQIARSFFPIGFVQSTCSCFRRRRRGNMGDRRFVGTCF